MSEISDIGSVTEEQRQAVREKYGAAGSGKVKNESLSGPRWMSVTGLLVGIFSLITVYTADNLLTVTVANGLVVVGFIVCFVAQIGRLVAKAIITGRD